MAKPQTGVAGRWLGMELRRFREAAGLSLDTVAAVLDWSSSTLSRMERSGRPETTPEEVSALLACMRVRGEDRARTMRLAQTLRYQGLWEWEADSGTTNDSARVYATFEAAAVRIIDVEPMLVPGLLQTADYCRALLQGFGVKESAAMKRTARRLGRQELLSRPDSAELIFVIGEAALRRPLPTRLLMARQVRHIAKQAELPKVSVHVLPDSIVAHPALRGSFVVLEFEEAAPIAMVEGGMSGHYPESPAEINAFRLDAERMVDLALDERGSMELLRAIAEDLERTG